MSPMCFCTKASPSIKERYFVFIKFVTLYSKGGTKIQYNTLSTISIPGDSFLPKAQLGLALSFVRA